ncbi:hypothetical protein FRC11_004537, partial [Ceratobasidium sp. 423]
VQSTSRAVSTREFSNEKDLSDSLVEGMTSHAEVKQQALIRDNYRCMLSGAIDTVSVESLPWLMDKVMNSRQPLVMSTHCCHILPQCAGHSPTEESRDPTTFGTLAQLFGSLSDHEPFGPETDDLRNIMTLSIEVHHSFSNLDIWLKPVEGAKNRYHIRRREFYIEQDLPLMITFSNGSTGLPLPDPRYLAIHAACARVAQSTGATKYIAGILHNTEG